MFLKLRFLLIVALFSTLSTSFVVPASHENASASDFTCPGPLERSDLAVAQVMTIDHSVLHVSTVPANAGQSICLFLRERVASNREVRKLVLMIHGASVPVLPGFELRKDHYDWAVWLAQAGAFDVFMLDFQGSGLSPRPKMNDPCNVPLSQQSILIPNPLSATCPDLGINPSYKFQLINSQSDWAELDTVVDYIRALRGVDKVALVSWSQGSFRIGPYAVMHPDKVDSLLFYAPFFNPAGRPGMGPDGFSPPLCPPPAPPGTSLPCPGTPMTLATRSNLIQVQWRPEVQCEGQREDGIEEFVWSSIMQNDEIGRNWGPRLADGTTAEGVMRVRTPFLWGWNSTTVAKASDGQPILGGSVLVLIIRGEFAAVIAPTMWGVQLYDSIPGDHKLYFNVQCAGHFMVWERQRRVLHHISKEWLKHGAVEGFTNGVFFVDTEGVIH